MLYFSVYHLNVDAGIMITGSHNPPEYNGFKIVLNKKPFYSSNIQNLKNIVFKDNYTKGLKKNINILDQYTKRLLQDISIEKKLKVAWDAGNGSVGVTINNVIKISNHLQKDGIIIRQLDSYNLPHCLRITIGTEEEMQLTIKSLKKL